MSPRRPAVVLAGALLCTGLSASPVLATGPAADPSAGRNKVLGEQCFSVPAIYLGSVLVFPGGRYCVLTR